MSQDNTAERPVSRLRVWGPIAAILLMIAWTNIPPYRGQIQEKKRGVFSWTWRLYEHGGRDICDVRYFDMNRDGEPVERWRLLGYERPGKMPDKLSRIHKNALFHDYARVCRAQREAGDPHPNLQVYARCGHELGWKEVERRKRNVCEIPRQAPVKKSSKARP